MKKIAILGSLLIAGSLFSGCASNGSTVETKKGAVMGGIGGAVIGGVIGHQSGRGLEGAAIGAAGGAAAGGVMGSAKDEEKGTQNQR
jgi:outer membrane lipoprotein SlyB